MNAGSSIIRGDRARRDGRPQGCVSQVVGEGALQHLSEAKFVEAFALWIQEHSTIVLIADRVPLPPATTGYSP